MRGPKHATHAELPKSPVGAQRTAVCVYEYKTARMHPTMFAAPLADERAAAWRWTDDAWCVLSHPPHRRPSRLGGLEPFQHAKQAPKASTARPPLPGSSARAPRRHDTYLYAPRLQQSASAPRPDTPSQRGGGRVGDSAARHACGGTVDEAARQDACVHHCTLVETRLHLTMMPRARISGRSRATTDFSFIPCRDDCSRLAATLLLSEISQCLLILG